MKKSFAFIQKQSLYILCKIHFVNFFLFTIIPILSIINQIHRSQFDNYSLQLLEMKLITLIPPLVQNIKQQNQQVMLAMAQMIGNGQNGYQIYQFFVNKYLSMTPIILQNSNTQSKTFNQCLQQQDNNYFRLQTKNISFIQIYEDNENQYQCTDKNNCTEHQNNNYTSNYDKFHHRTQQDSQLYLTSNVRKFNIGGNLKNMKNIMNMKEDWNEGISSHQTNLHPKSTKQNQQNQQKQVTKKDILILSMIKESKQYLQKIQKQFLKNKIKSNIVNIYNNEKETFRTVSSDLISFYRLNGFMIEEIKNPILKTMISIIIESKTIISIFDSQTNRIGKQPEATDENEIHKSFIQVFKKLTDQSTMKNKSSVQLIN